MENKISSSQGALFGQAARGRPAIRSSVWPPDTVLRMQGRKDAGKGESVCKKQTEKIRSRAEALVAFERAGMERDLYPFKKEAERLKNQIRFDRERLGHLPPYLTDGSAESVRINRKIAGLKRELRTDIYQATAQLADYEAQIRCRTQVFEAGAGRIRTAAASKIKVYELGLMEGGKGDKK